MTATVLTCPAPAVIVVSGKRSHPAQLASYRCQDPDTEAVQAWEVQSLGEGPSARDTITLQELQMIMPVVLMALVVATGYRWLITMIRNR